MALTGNELVTADGLKALHDYNEEAYFKTDGSITMDNKLGIDGDIIEFIQGFNRRTGRSFYVKMFDDGNLHLYALKNGDNYTEIVLGEENTSLTDLLKISHVLNSNVKEYKVYHEGNKPTAEDVGAIAKSEIYQYIVTEDYTSILDWATKNPNTIGVYQGNAYEDCPFNNTHFGMIISVSNIDASYASGGFVIATGNASNEMYIRKINYNTGEWFNDWSRLGDFTADGSVPMTGTLRVSNGYGRFLADTGYAQITTTEEVNDTNNCRGLVLKNSKAEGNVRNTAQIFDKVDGTVTYYQLFGQHNTDLLASTIQTLINEGKITIN